VVGRAGRVRVGPREVVRAYARMTGFPEALIDPAARLDVDAVRAFFRARVIGQPHVIDRLVQVIVLLKAGLDEPGRPLGSFLFMGPTGVGKTESALALTEYLFGDRRRLVRFDLGEYAAPGSALRLVDGPGGQGALTQAVREQPFSVVLLDEVEKADGGVHDLLLQVLGEGRLTDGTGRTVRFDHTLVVLTSNLGAVRRAAIGYGGGAARPAAAHYLDAAERFFRPELVNRIDHLVPFDVLSEDALAEIARLLLAQALEREGLTRRGVQVELDDAVVAHVVARGYDPRYGARPMKRAVEAEVIVPLARALAASGVGGDAAAAPSIGRVRLEVVDGAVAVRGVG
jgi:ATP-dependent Clp protease ATP-binding subunit ClpC